MNDLTGKKFGMLTAIEPASCVGGKWRWLFKCDCGSMKEAAGTSVTSGNTVSCGCWRARRGGLGSKRVYQIWHGMVKRCTKTSHGHYALYGGRGIKVCDRWMDFANFVADMGEPKDGMTLDRIDGDGDYTPENCRWADWVTQANNRSNNRHLTHNGETLTLAQWAARAGIRSDTLKVRLTRLGWSFEKAITEPVRG